MTRWMRTFALAGLAATAVACSGDAEPAADAEQPETAATETPAEEPTPAPAAEDPAADAAGATSGGAVSPLMNPADPSMNEQAPATFRARFVTSKGEFVAEFHRAWAPNGVDRVYNLIQAGFYDGVRFFRVLDGFMAQFGMHGDPAIGSRWANANIPDDPVVEGNTRGRVTFAKTAAPDSRSTQLFINFADNSPLDPDGFAAIGEVVEGMDVVDRLYSGYGEGAPRGSGPDQRLIRQRGNEYLSAEFPELDYIESAEIID